MTQQATYDGPVHGGQGHQFNGPTYFFDGERLVRTGNSPWAAPRDQLASLRRQFVEPPGYGTAARLLADNGCAILIGARGIGMRAAGKVLLSRLGGPDAVVQELSTTPDTPGEPVLDVAQVTPNDLILLDLTDVDSDTEESLQLMRGLRSYRAGVRERGAYLVVVLAQELDHRVDAELRPLLAPLRRPDALDVVRRHLQVAGIPYATEELRANDALNQRMAADSIPTLVHLVLLIGEARNRLGSSAGFDKWLTTAFETLDKLDGRVADQVQQQRDGRQRALLLAAAMLPGAPADQVQFAATALAATTTQPDDERPALERDDLAQRLRELKLMTDDNGHVGFGTFDYDRAVRRHFWTYFPELRDAFANWARVIGASAGIGPQFRSEFTARFADEVLRTDRPGDIVLLAEAWTTPGQAGDRSLPSAAVALETGLGHRRHGYRFRQLIYRWATDKTTDQRTAYLAITLCANVIASTHPAEALVRLHHFARRQSGDVQEAAIEALFDLIRDIPFEFRRLLDRVVTKLPAWPYDVDFTLFLQLARPDRLAPPGVRPRYADVMIRNQLMEGWQIVLAERPSDMWAATVQDWLSAAEAEPDSDFWLDTLAVGGAKPGPGGGRLYAVARDWARTPGADRVARSRIAVELTKRMDVAVGIARRSGGQ